MESKLFVKSEEHTEFDWEVNKNGTEYTLKNNAKISIDLSDNRIYTFSFQKGFKCDGLSVPKLFRWFLPSWDKKNMLYNLAGVLHDALYANKGFNKFTRDDSDAIFRGLLRISGCNRGHASTADFMLCWFAKNHWGTDDKHCKDLVKMTIKTK